MHREKLLFLLGRYKPIYPEEVKYKEDIISFIKNNSNCFDRELDTGHITGSSWLLNKARDKVLLMHHRKLDKWLQPGGHADGDSDILQVAIKEAKEESGIESIEVVSANIFDIDVHAIPQNSKEKQHFHYDIRFLLRVSGDEEFQQNEESKELGWFEPEEIQGLTTEFSIIRMCRKWQNYK